MATPWPKRLRSLRPTSLSFYSGQPLTWKPSSINIVPALTPDLLSTLFADRESSPHRKTTLLEPHISFAPSSKEDNYDVLQIQLHRSGHFPYHKALSTVSPMAAWFSYLRIPVIASSSLAALGSSLLYFKQNDIIYPANLPAGSRDNVPTPEQFHLNHADSIEFPTPDGETLHAYLLRPPNAALKKNITLLTFHGNAGNVGHRLPIGKVLSESLGCHVFMVEYRGYGKSTGAPDEEGLNIDGQTALDFVRNHDELRKTKIVIYGQSLGGAVSVRLVQANQDIGDIAGVILENTFTSIRKLIPTVMPPAKYIASFCHQRWASDETMALIKNKTIPMLFLSGLKDEIVPPTMMKSLFEICPTRKVWKDFPNGDHNSTVAEPGYFDAIWAFLVQDVLQGPENGSALRTGATDVDPEELWT